MENPVVVTFSILPEAFEGYVSPNHYRAIEACIWIDDFQCLTHCLDKGIQLSDGFIYKTPITSCCHR